MIETTLIEGQKKIVYHRVSSAMNELEAVEGAKEAMSIVSEIVKNKERFNLVLDMRGYIFEDIKPHRAWSLGFKEQRLLKDNVDCVAIVGDETPQLRAEKELMESGSIKFFTDQKLATQWISNA